MKNPTGGGPWDENKNDKKLPVVSVSRRGLLRPMLAYTLLLRHRPRPVLRELVIQRVPRQVVLVHLAWGVATLK